MKPKRIPWKTFKGMGDFCDYLKKANPVQLQCELCYDTKGTFMTFNGKFVCLKCLEELTRLHIGRYGVPLTNC